MISARLASLVGLLLLSQSLFAQKEVIGQVQMGDKPIPNATVWLVSWSNHSQNREKNARSERIKTDSDGQFRFIVDSVSRDQRYLLARDPQGNWGRSPTRLNFRQPTVSTKIELVPSGTFSRRFVDEAGKPLAGLEVKLLSLFATGSRVPMPKEIQELWTHKTDANGKLEFRDLPIEDGVLYSVGDLEFISSFRSQKLKDGTTVTLRKRGSVKVRLKGIDDPKRLKDLRVYVNHEGNHDTQLMFTSKSAKLNGEETITIENLYPGKARVGLGSSGSTEWVSSQSVPVQIQSDRVVEIELPVERRHEVALLCLDGESNRPLSGITFRAFDQKNGANQYVTHTGADGWARLYLPLGQYQFSTWNYPNRYPAEPTGVTDNQFELKAPGKLILPEKKFYPNRRVQLKVVDASGEPVREATVFAPDPSGSEIQTSRTNEKGIAELLVARVPTSLTVHARQGDQLVSIGDLVNFTADSANIPVLQLHSEKSTRFLGRVSDAQGKPMPHAQVILSIEMRQKLLDGMFQTRHVLETMETDRDGKWKSQSVWQNQEYSVEVRGPADSARSLTQLKSGTATTFDCGSVGLPTGTRKIELNLLDAQGKPIPKAMIRDLWSGRSLGFSNGSGIASIACPAGQSTILKVEADTFLGNFLLVNATDHRYELTLYRPNETQPRRSGKPIPESLQKAREELAEDLAKRFAFQPVDQIPANQMGSIYFALAASYPHLAQDYYRRLMAHPKGQANPMLKRFYSEYQLRMLAPEQPEAALKEIESIPMKQRLRMLFTWIKSNHETLPNSAKVLLKESVKWVQAGFANQVEEADVIGLIELLKLQEDYQDYLKITKESIRKRAEAAKQPIAGYDWSMRIAIYDPELAIKVARNVVDAERREFDEDWASKVAIEYHPKKMWELLKDRTDRSPRELDSYFFRIAARVKQADPKLYQTICSRINQFDLQLLLRLDRLEADLKSNPKQVEASAEAVVELLTSRVGFRVNQQQLGYFAHVVSKLPEPKRSAMIPLLIQSHPGRNEYQPDVDIEWNLRLGFDFCDLDYSLADALMQSIPRDDWALANMKKEWRSLIPVALMDPKSIRGLVDRAFGPVVDPLTGLQPDDLLPLITPLKDPKKYQRELFDQLLSTTRYY